MLSILGIYGAGHVYVFVRVRSAFPLGSTAGIILAVFMAVMTIAPVIVRILENHGYELQARLASNIGYTWMGILFLFFSFSLLIDLYRLRHIRVGTAPSQGHGPVHAVGAVRLSSPLCHCPSYRILWIF